MKHVANLILITLFLVPVAHAEEDLLKGLDIPTKEELFGPDKPLEPKKPEDGGYHHEELHYFLTEGRQSCSLRPVGNPGVRPANCNPKTHYYMILRSCNYSCECKFYSVCIPQGRVHELSNRVR